MWTRPRRGRNAARRPGTRRSSRPPGHTTPPPAVPRPPQAGRRPAGSVPAHGSPRRCPRRCGIPARDGPAVRGFDRGSPRPCTACRGRIAAVEHPLRVQRDDVRMLEPRQREMLLVLGRHDLHRRAGRKGTTATPGRSAPSPRRQLADEAEVAEDLAHLGERPRRRPQKLIALQQQLQLAAPLGRSARIAPVSMGRPRSARGRSPRTAVGWPPHAAGRGAAGRVPQASPAGRRPRLRPVDRPAGDPGREHAGRIVGRGRRVVVRRQGTSGLARHQRGSAEPDASRTSDSRRARSSRIRRTLPRAGRSAVAISVSVIPWRRRLRISRWRGAEGVELLPELAAFDDGPGLGLAGDRRRR